MPAARLMPPDWITAARDAWRRHTHGGPEPEETPIPVPATVPPPMEPLDIEIIRRTVSSLDTDSQRCAGDFYGYLFAARPELRGMFPPEMNNQNERLFAALLKIVQLLDQPELLTGYLGQLGADHLKYGVEAGHYAPVGQALLRTLRRHCREWDSAAEEAWLIAYSAAANLMINGASAVPGPAVWRGQVVRHERRASDLAVLSVHTDQPLPYQPGQYVTIQTGRWARVWRPFSVANAPSGDSDVIDLHVRAVSGGWVSTALVRNTALDDELLIGPAMGTMTPQAANGHDLLCVAGGTGLAPIKAVVESVLARDEEAMAAGHGARRNIALFHGARSPLDLYDMPALRELSASYPWLQVVPVVNGRAKFDGHRGNVTDVAMEYGEWDGRAAFVSGPAGMKRATVAALLAAGLSEDDLHYDRVELEGV